MINKIKQLTKIFLLDYYEKMNLIDQKTNKINKRNKIVWLSVILIISITYLSSEIIKFLMKTGQPILFLKIYLPIVATIIIFELILLTCNIFYYSNDLKSILPLPIKPIEILLAKLNTITVIVYYMESLLLVVPLIMYGMLVQKSIAFFILSIICIIIFPIFYILIISFFVLILMQFSKFIKNRTIFQIFVTTLLIIAVNYTIIEKVTTIIFEGNDINNFTQIQITNEKIDKINNIFIMTNPLIKLIISNNFIDILKNFLEIILINISVGVIFIKIGKNLYFKNILRNINNIDTLNKKIKNTIKCKPKNKIINYLDYNVKSLLRNPMFFIQNIVQYIFIVGMVCFLITVFSPIIIQEVKGENIIDETNIEEVKIDLTLIVVAIIQLIFTFSNLSITAISREGKNAIFIKYIPISLYTQIILKALPQIIINIFAIVSILLCIWFNDLNINIIYYIIIFVLAMILNCINSYVMLVIDLKKPNLNWTNEESVAKDNQNKLYQYIFTIFVFLILKYFSKIFRNCNFKISMIIIISLFLFSYIILKIYIKKYINKIFKKIY